MPTASSKGRGNVARTILCKEWSSSPREIGVGGVVEQSNYLPQLRPSS